jgi:hypothetical protein
LNVQVLALDLERTLIDETLSAQPRPGLLDFLTFCHEHFGRIALFTTVEEMDARAVLAELDRGGHMPMGLLARFEYVAWCGEYKDLGFISDAVPGDVLLVDDDIGWIRPDQRDRWIPIVAWDGGADDELRRVRAILEDRLARSTQ